MTARLLVPLLLTLFPVRLFPQAVGVVAVAPSGTKYIRTDALTRFTAVSGELLRVGDRLLSVSTTALTHYGTNSSYTFIPAPTLVSYPLPRPQTSTGDLRLDQQGVRKLGKGDLRTQPWPVQLAAPGGSLPPAIVRPAASASIPALPANADPVLRLDRAVRLERAGALRAAITEYEQLRSVWPEADWVRTRIASLTRRIEAAPQQRQPPSPAQTFAVLAGMSSFQTRLPSRPGADAQVRMLERHLVSKSGGSVPAANITTLVGPAATLARFRLALQETFRRRTNAGDSVFIFINGLEPSSSRGVLLAADTDPREPRGTGFRLKELADLIDENKQRLSAVWVLTNIDRLEQRTATWNKEPLQRVLASAPGVSISLITADQRGAKRQFDSLLERAIAGEADTDRNGIVTADELVAHMNAAGRNTRRAAIDRLHPTTGRFERLSLTLASSLWIPGLLWQTAARPGASTDLAAEDEVQQILLRYLDGDEHPLEAAVFERGLALTNTPAARSGEDPVARERHLFFLGRVLTFRGDYGPAALALEEAVKSDPDFSVRIQCSGHRLA
jgi:hypothetical protein